MGKEVSPWGENLGVQSIVLETQQYEGKWLHHCEKVDTNQIPKQTLKDKQKWEKKHGKTEKKDDRTNLGKRH